MKAWRVHELGEPERVLRFDEVPDPQPAPGSVLVRVRAVALNFPDVLLCQGRYQDKPPLPFTPGLEVCGEVVATGAGSTWAPGASVYGAPGLPGGGLAEYVLLPEAETYPVPDGMPDTQAAGLYITYQTAYVGLHRRAALKSGETLLVHAGAGGVGSAAIQVGRAAGARVIATAGGPAKTARCLQLGAHEAVDYNDQDVVTRIRELTSGRGADVVFDPVGGDVFDASRRCVAFEGRLLVIGFAGGRIPQVAAGHVLVKNYSVVGVHWGLYRRHDPDYVRSVHDALARLYAQGAIEPLVGLELPLDRAPEALRALADRATVGKVVLRPQPAPTAR
ncbi:MAG TPA: NADPH:quinone oxidoreductase family protein [Mycobacteriales bacterium]|nr:NADPH:quinone oxidoreductase family protein [Mycobacteriales bacterium]